MKQIRSFSTNNSPEEVNQVTPCDEPDYYLCSGFPHSTSVTTSFDKHLFPVYRDLQIGEGIVFAQLMTFGVFYRSLSLVVVTCNNCLGLLGSFTKQHKVCVRLIPGVILCILAASYFKIFFLLLRL